MSSTRWTSDVPPRTSSARTWSRRSRSFARIFLYQEDLMFMGSIAFLFYVPTAINYLLGEQADDAADAVGSFCGVIEFRLKYEPAEVAPVGPILREGIRGILKVFDR